MAPSVSEIKSADSVDQVASNIAQLKLANAVANPQEIKVEKDVVRDHLFLYVWLGLTMVSHFRAPRTHSIFLTGIVTRSGLLSSPLVRHSTEILVCCNSFRVLRALRCWQAR